jgi:prepilin-type N-terminal cleavage/methylation domain-containing protein
MKFTNTKNNAFTLIELLIVVAIIAILAAIAVPNFLEAQTRAKVSRVQADMRSIATGLEAYAVDNNSYPPNLVDATQSGNIMTMMGNTRMPFVPPTLTTPVTYMSSYPLDTFFPMTGSDHFHSFMYFNSTNTPNDALRQEYFAATKGIPAAAAGNERTPAWALLSAGPDQSYGVMAMEMSVQNSLPVYGLMINNGMGMGGGMGGGMMANMGSPLEYDPTNGTTSEGDITRFP